MSNSNSSMKLPLQSYDGKPGAAKDVKDTAMLNPGAREHPMRTTGMPNNDRSKVKHKAYGQLGVRGHA
jgi:hypothetical protein